MLSRSARFDWYQTTVLVQCPQASGLVAELLRAWPLSDWAPARNLNGYTHGGAIVRGGRVLCHLCWGGQTGVNCKSTSEESPTLAQALEAFGKSHLPTRIDSCVDWREEGLFDSLAGHLIKFAQDNRLSLNQQGDWVRGEARTLYVGSKDSPVRLVLYEKGYEQGGDAPKDWVRLEARIRPKREHRCRVAGWSASDVYGAGWLPDALQALGWGELQDRAAIGTVWRKSDAERARAALLKQYGAILDQWASEAGSWEGLGACIGECLGNTAKSSSPEEKAPGNRAATLQPG